MTIPIATNPIDTSQSLAMGDLSTGTDSGGRLPISKPSVHQHLQEEIRRRVRIEELLACEREILELIATDVALPRTLEGIVAAVHRLLPSCPCVIQVRRVEKRPLQDGADDDGGGGLNEYELVGDVEAVPACPPVCEKRRVYSDLSSLPGHMESTGKLSLRTCWCEPVTSRDARSLGMIFVFARESRGPSEDEVEVLAMGARLAALALRRAYADARSQRQLSQLAQVARLATMGEMASGLAHELNQPLCAILNYSAAGMELSKRSNVDATIRQILDEIGQQASRAGQVIRRLRDFVKRREPQREPTTIDLILEEVTALTEVEVRHQQARLRVQLGGALPKVWADVIQIEQVLVNLIRNSLEAMQDVSPAQRFITLQAQRRSDDVEISVTDNGHGIARDMVERCFDPFYTTKTDGMGMGLSICRYIVEAHDGRIWAGTAGNGGTTVCFTLPIARRTRDAKSTHGVRR